jgi:hypothetical protein
LGIPSGVSSILDRPVWNEAGQQLVEITDHPPKREVEKIILSVGRSLGIEEKLLALSSVLLKMNGTGIVFSLTWHQVRDLSGFHYGK